MGKLCWLKTWLLRFRLLPPIVTSDYYNGNCGTPEDRNEINNK